MIDMETHEREYVVNRLDREHVNEVARQVRAALDAGRSIEASYMPGDGTWYALTFVPLEQLDVAGAPGGGTSGESPTSYLRGQGAHTLIFLAQQSKGVGVTDDIRNWPMDADSVGLDLIDNKASALAIAELLRAIWTVTL